jgi:biotin carboxyl carrier protein
MVVTFLHLSDIHFNKRHSPTWDPDEDLRNELLHDLRLVVSNVGLANSVLVSGDIAYSGKQQEYLGLSDWLGSVANLACGNPQAILTVPGNHDVDRSATEGSRLLRIAQERIRHADDEEVEKEAVTSMEDPQIGPLLLSPLSDYNEFARPFGCAINHRQPWWERQFELGNGYLLRLRGATSVLVSNKYDDENANRLIVPPQMIRMRRDPRTIGALLCHHPLSWLRPRDPLEDILAARYGLQMFGHKHVFRIRENANCLVVHAGATHPERVKDWQPHYNLLQAEVTADDDGKPQLEIVVHPRRWHPEDQRFGVDPDAHGNVVRQFRRSLSVEEPKGPSETRTRRTATPSSRPASRKSTLDHQFTIASRHGAPKQPVHTERQRDSEAGAPEKAESLEVVRLITLEGSFEGTIRWLKEVGDRIEEDEPLYEISTDKADIEVPSPFSGAIIRILVEDGASVMVGSEIAVLESSESRT